MRISKSTQRFSGIDLSTNHLTDTGVVFPLASATNKPNFAGIMEHRGGAYQQNMLARCEYRIANGAINTALNTPITYAKGRCIAIVHNPITTTPSLSEQLLGIKPLTTSYATLDALPEVTLEHKLLTLLNNLWETCPLTPMTDFIASSNVIEKVIAPRPYTERNGKPTLVGTPPVDYINVAKQIKWLTYNEKRTIPHANLLTSVIELATFFYGDANSFSTYQQASRASLMDEYHMLEKLVKDEIAEAEQEAIEDAEYAKLLAADEPEEVLDEEDVHMLTVLLRAGIPITDLMTSTDILNAYCALTSNNY